jgi:hypothetical protein
MRLKVITAIASVSALSVIGLGAGAAFAGTHGVSAVTHSAHHPDTTSVSGACTMASSNGPQWAWDNLSLRLSAVSTGTNAYAVTIRAHGSFSAFANPTTGACYRGRGSVSGWIEYDVYSTTAPSPASVPSQEPGSMSQSAILQQFFGGSALITGGGHYHYSYNRIAGARYTQTG